MTDIYDAHGNKIATIITCPKCGAIYPQKINGRLFLFPQCQACKINEIQTTIKVTTT